MAGGADRGAFERAGDFQRVEGDEFGVRGDDGLSTLLPTPENALEMSWGRRRMNAAEGIIAEPRNYGARSITESPGTSISFSKAGAALAGGEACLSGGTLAET